MSTLAHFDSDIISQINKAQSSRVPTPLPNDPYVAIRQAHLVDTDIESRPLEDLRETEIPQPLLVVSLLILSLDDLHLIESPTHYSVTRQNKVPSVETDPGSFILPCIIGNHSMSNVLADLGASISIMPYFLFKRLGRGSLKPIKMTIKIADRSMQYPKGIKENVIVKISNFVFPVDFVILDIMEDENVPIILGIPMLATAHAKIDVYGKKISLGVGNDQVVFNINKKESTAFISPICVINEVDKTQELVMNDEKVRDFENYLSPEYGSQDIISLSPSEIAEDKK
ncbi:putative reverse transcriptase, RNA-dependent DNA polymerase [Tanacetum coccineum]